MNRQSHKHSRAEFQGFFHHKAAAVKTIVGGGAGPTGGQISMQGLGKGLPVLVITIVRVLGVSAPLAVFFIFYMGKSVEWVWYSMMLSTVVAFIIALSWLISTVSKLPKSKAA